MKKQIIASTIVYLLMGAYAYAGCQMAGYEDSKCSTAASPQAIANCKTMMSNDVGDVYHFCYKNDKGQYKKVYTCLECKEGYILVPSHILIDFGCNESDIVSMWTCQPCSVVKACDPTTEIPYDADAWSDSWNGYQVNKWTECNTDNCTWEERSEYRCADGYYGERDKIVPNYIEGFGVMGINGCTRCPINAVATAYGMSVAGDNETIQRCYLSEAGGSDIFGVYKIYPEYAKCYHD